MRTFFIFQLQFNKPHMEKHRPTCLFTFTREYQRGTYTTINRYKSRLGEVYPLYITDSPQRQLTKRDGATGRFAEVVVNCGGFGTPTKIRMNKQFLPT